MKTAIKMQYSFLKYVTRIFLSLSCGALLFPAGVWAQTAPSDTIYNPVILYSAVPRTYEIAGITVSGVSGTEDYVLIGLSGLSVGDRISIPGDAITEAIKTYMKQGLFSDASISATKAYENKIWLNVDLKLQPRISELNVNGIRKSEQEDLNLKLGLTRGGQISPNLINQAKVMITKHFTDKGFHNVDVEIVQRPDRQRENFVKVDVNIDKNKKTRVQQIDIEGNEVLSDRKLKRVMKKTNERGKLINIFRPKKFIPAEYKKDKQLIIDKYNELGYRDAVIVSDSVWDSSEKTVSVKMKIDEGKRYFLRDITWVGNTIYSTEQLDFMLNMKKGDVYNQKKLNDRLMGDEDAVTSNYQNQGYVFAQVIPVETNVDNDSIDLEIQIEEGKQAHINKVNITGNDRLYEHVVRRELRTRPGALFSRDELIRSVREIAAMGHFNPESINPNVVPNRESGTVDITYELEPKASDQIEFSAGWGQTGIIGRLSLKFTNFSIKNLFHPKTYKGIIPQGEGQTFTISAQTNAQYYQAYSISFMDPWFGGKRPNSLSLSAYYSRQTDISSSYYNSNYLNSYYGYYGYGNDVDYSSAWDPSKSLQMVGVSVGFGKRLTWPDDYFTFSAELSYQLYLLNDWQYIRFFQNGTSNSISLNLTLARSSTDNPIFPRNGSQFALSVQLTPPYSLFTGIDYSKLDPKNSKDHAKLYRWIEYNKWKFKAKLFTPISKEFAKRRVFVLMTRAEFGFLGSYNKYKKSPFETFYMGGDGMTGYTTNYATETIGLRGYENGSLTPWGGEAYAYARIGMELRFPIMLENSTSIYALTFIEGGNAWVNLNDFNPFNLKRSAGVGVRIFLPMVGMLGIDYAYGFDKVFGRRGGNQIHFLLGQEF